jgi:hypothetical protein
MFLRIFYDFNYTGNYNSFTRKSISITFVFFFSKKSARICARL